MLLNLTLYDRKQEKHTEHTGSDYDMQATMQTGYSLQQSSH